MNTKLIALVASGLIISAALGYSISTTRIATLQARISELETKTAVMTNDYNNLSAEHDQLTFSYDLLSAQYALLNESNSEKATVIQLLYQQINNLNQTYLKLLEQYETLRSRAPQRIIYIAEETQNITMDPVPEGVRRHYIFINIPIPEDAGQDVALVHFDKDDQQLAVPFYYFMDVNASSRSVISSGYFPFPCQILEYRIGENSTNGYLYIQTVHTPTEQGYIAEAGDYLVIEYLTSPKGLAEVTVVYWDEEIF